MKTFNLSRWALEHKSFVVYLMLIVALAGIFEYRRLHDTDVYGQSNSQESGTAAPVRYEYRWPLEGNLWSRSCAPPLGSLRAGRYARRMGRR